jgi:hypothetical protein
LAVNKREEPQSKTQIVFIENLRLISDLLTHPIIEYNTFDLLKPMKQVSLQSRLYGKLPAQTDMPSEIEKIHGCEQGYP